jgi:hypothetical protein
VKGESISYLEYAGRKIESVRKLKRTSTSIIDRGQKYNPRPLTKILGGILASTNTIKKTETIKGKLEKLTGLQGLDMGCAVDYGAFFIDYAGEEDIKNTDFQKRIADYYAYRVGSRLARRMYRWFHFSFN